MKRKCYVWCTLSAVIVFLSVLSGCSKVDNNLLKKTVVLVDEFAQMESGGYRWESYLTNTETLTQSVENWFCPAGGDADWCSLTEVYKEDGAIQMESGVAQRSGMMYQRFSIDGAEADWRESEGPVPSTKMHFPRHELLAEAEDYELFRKGEDGSITFSYSPAGLEAFQGQLVALVKEQVPTELDEQYTEEQWATLEQQYAHIVATAEQTKVTAFSGTITLDETGAILSHQIQYSVEGPELEPDGNGGWTVTSTTTADMRFVTEILAASNVEVEQKLAELFTQLP